MSSLELPEVELTDDNCKPHPNADRLDLFAGPQGPCVVSRGLRGKMLFVPADTLCQVDKPHFSFLKDRAKEGFVRIKATKLRGALSVGLVIPGSATDTHEDLGVRKWEPPPLKPHKGSTLCAVDTAESPCAAPTYDVENNWKTLKTHEWRDLDITWQVTEKIHGANWRFTMKDGVPNVGSRSRWVKPGKSVWWRAHDMYAEKLAKLPSGLVLYAEVYGKVQDLTYSKEDVDLAVFDCFDVEADDFVTPERLEEMLSGLGLAEKCAPLFSYASGTLESVVEHFKAMTLLPEYQRSLIDGKTICEGFVIRPYRDEVTNMAGERCITKVVSPTYLTRSNGSESQE